MGKTNKNVYAAILVRHFSNGEGVGGMELMYNWTSADVLSTFSTTILLETSPGQKEGFATKQKQLF